MRLVIFILWLVCLAPPAFGQTPKNVTSPQLEKAKILIAEGHLFEAQQKLELLNDSANSEIAYFIGYVWYLLANYEKALTFCERAIRLNPNYTTARIVLAQSYKSLSLFEQAKLQYKSILGIDSTHYQALLGIAMVCYDNQQYEEAIPYFESLVRFGYRSSTIYLYASRCYQYTGDKKSYLQYTLWKALELSPTNIPVLLEYIQFLRDGKKVGQALSLVDKYLQQYPTESRLWKERAKILQQMLMFDSAIVSYQRCIQRGDSSDFVIRELGICYYRLKQYDSASIYLLRAVRSNDPSRQIDVRATSFLAFTKRDQQDFVKAIEYFELTTQGLKRSELGEIYLQMGITHRKAGQFERALVSYQQAQRLDAENIMIAYELAILYDKHLNNKKLAVQFYKEFITKASPNSGDEPTVRYTHQRLNELGIKVFSTKNTERTLHDSTSTINVGSDSTIRKL